MPRIAHQWHLADQLTPREQVLVQFVVTLVNPLRASVTPPLPPLTDAEVTEAMRTSLRALRPIRAASSKEAAWPN
jgi:hypothetical protein